MTKTKISNFKKPNVYSLDINDRISIVSILPESDNADRLYLRKSVYEKVFISTEESKRAKIESVSTEKGGNVLQWKNGFSVNIEFTDPEKNYIKSILVKINEVNKLHYNWLNIYDLFVK